MILLSLALAFVVGLSLGVLGGGGSILTVPILVYAGQLSPRQAVVLSLAVVGAVSAIGALGAWRRGHVRLRLGLTFSATTMAGTWVGTILGRRMDDLLQLVLFAGVMLVAAVLMLRRSYRQDAPQQPERHSSQTGVLVRGLGVGLLTGVVGVGGGFLIVPALVLLGPGMSMRDASGTSLLVISLSSLVGFLGYLGDVPVPWAYGLGFTALAVAGVLLGGRLAHRLPHHSLQRAFAWFLVAAAILLLALNLPSVLHA